MIVFRPFKNLSDGKSFDVWYYKCYLGTYYKKFHAQQRDRDYRMLMDSETYEALVKKIELIGNLYD